MRRHCLPCEATFEMDLPRCPTCGSRLLTDDERMLWYQAQEELTNQSFVPAHVLDGPVDEAFLCELLRDAGVPYIVRGHRYDGFQGTFASQEGWGVLLVPEDEIQKALDLVALYQQSQVVEEGEVEG